MARQVHWTHDPRCSHLRNPPAWYQLEPQPFFTPRPAARMEKLVAESHKHQWQWQSDVEDGSEVCPQAWYEAACWPCGVYSRAWSRLRYALGGADALHIPEQGVFNIDCLQFAVCCPFYGCFLSKLQSTVRAFYTIDGTDKGDWKDTCCHPCFSIMRAEQEIIFREKQYQNLRSQHVSGDHRCPYYSQTPMSCSLSCSSKGSGTSVKVPPAALEQTATFDKTILPPIPEQTPRRPSLYRRGKTPAVSSPLKTETKFSDSSTSNSLASVHQLEDHVKEPQADAAQAESSGKENGKSKIFKPKRFWRRHNEPIAESSDESVEKTDCIADAVQPKHSPPYSVALVDSLGLSPRSVPHHLQDDDGFVQVPFTAAHGLDDHARLTKTPKIVPHHLEEDQSPATTQELEKQARQNNSGTRVTRHVLKEVSLVRKPPVSFAHALRDDGRAAAIPPQLTHTLEDDHIVSIPSRLAPHSLDDDNRDTPSTSTSSTRTRDIGAVDYGGVKLKEHLLQDDEHYHAPVITIKPHALQTDAMSSQSAPAAVHAIEHEGSSMLKKVVMHVLHDDDSAVMISQGDDDSPRKDIGQKIMAAMVDEVVKPGKTRLKPAKTQSEPVTKVSTPAHTLGDDPMQTLKSSTPTHGLMDDGTLVMLDKAREAAVDEANLHPLEDDVVAVIEEYVEEIERPLAEPVVPHELNRDEVVAVHQTGSKPDSSKNA